MKCLCNKAPDRFCPYPAPTVRDVNKVCGLALCGRCGAGPEAKLCHSHFYTLRVDAWMAGLLSAAMAHGFSGDELTIYQRERFNDWRGFFRQDIEPEVAFAEDLEMAKMIEEFVTKTGKLQNGDTDGKGAV
jgi:hypothetical protein